MSRLAFALLALFSCSVAHAAFWDAQKLADSMMEWKKASQYDPAADYMKASDFTNYVAGIHDAGLGVLFCTPASATGGQVSGIVAKYLSESPQPPSKPAARVVEEALRQAYPCPAGRR